MNYFLYQQHYVALVVAADVAAVVDVGVEIEFVTAAAVRVFDSDAAMTYD